MNSNSVMKNEIKLFKPDHFDCLELMKCMVEFNRLNNKTKGAYNLRKKEICPSFRGDGIIHESTIGDPQLNCSLSTLIIHSYSHKNSQPFIYSKRMLMKLDQWSIQNQQNFGIMVSNQQLASSYLLPGYEKFEKILIILSQQLKVSGYQFYQLRKICNILFQKTAKFLKNNIQYNQLLESEKTKSLRGGGALCSNKIRPQDQATVSFTIPNEFFSNSEKYCQKLIDKIPFDENDTDTLISFQWFIHNEKNFWIVANNRNLASAFYDFSLLQLEQFLIISPKYLRVSGFLFYYLLKICNYFCQVIVKQQSFNEKREIKEEKQQELKVLITEINQQIQVESNRIWMTGVLYELQLIQTSITHLRTNSTKGRDALLNFIAGVATSLVSMKLTDELKQSLQDGAQLLLTIVYEEHIMNPIENYKIFQYFKELKWQIILTLGTDLGVYYTLDLLKESYSKYIKNSKNWIVHFCWIEMISEIFTYQPIISKSQFKIQDWNSLLQDNKIQLLPYDRNQAKLIIKIYQQDFSLQMLKTLRKIDYQEFQELKEQLLEINNNLKDQGLNFWNQYLSFEFEKQNSNNEQEQTQILVGLLRLDNEYFNRIISLYNQSKEGLIKQEHKQLKVLQQFNQNNQNQQVKELVINELQKIDVQIEKNLRKILLAINECQFYFQFIKTKLTHFFEIIKEIKELESKGINQEFTLFLEQLQAITLNHIPKVFQTWLEMQNILVQNQLNVSLLDIQNEIKSQQISSNLNQFEECVNSFQKVNIRLNNIQQKGQQFIFKLQGKIQKPYQISINVFYKQIEEIQTLEFSKLTFRKNSQSGDGKLFCFNFFFKNNEFSPNKFWKFDKLQDKKDSILQCQQILKIISYFKLLLSLIYHKSKQIRFSFKLQNDYVIDGEKQITSDSVQKNFINEIKEDVQHNFVEIGIIRTSLSKEEDKRIISEQLEKIIHKMQQHLKCFEKFTINPEIEEKIREIIKLIKQQISKLKIVILDLTDDQIQQQIELAEQQFKQLHLKIQDLVNQTTQKEKENNQQDTKFYKQLIIDNHTILKELRLQLYDTDKNWNIIYQLLVEYSKDNESDLNQTQIIDKIEKAYLSFTKMINEMSNFQMKFSLEQSQESAKLQLCEFQNFYFSLPKYFEHQKTKQQNPQCDYLEFMQELQNQQQYEKQESTNIIFKLFQSNSFRVRECLLFQLIQMQNQCSDDKIIKFSQQLIKQFWISENDQNVRQLLKNQELVEFQKKLFSYDLQSFSEQIKQEMESQLKQIEELEIQARSDRNSQKEDEFEEKLKKLYKEFEDKFDNVADMSDKVGLNLLFLKDMAKDIKVIKNKIDKLQETVNMIGNDIKKLRGKTFMELLQIRKEQVLMNKSKRDLDSVYIELQTQEINPKDGQVIETDKGSKTSCLFKEERLDFEGEINEFLWDEKEKQKDVMLIKGQAGSGKTRASKMIEEYLWTQQNQYTEPWIPIFVSLPQLKDPKYNLFYEVLESENYNFDSFQIKEFIEAIQKKQVRLILILDSYDEMKLENIESNLFKTNKFQEEFSLETPGETIKMIITVRSEILNQSNYQLLFYGNSLDQLKEIMLLPFKHEQAQEFLKQFSLLNIKRKISNFYDYQKQIRGGKFQIKEFLEIWASISPLLDDKNNKSNNIDQKQNEKQAQNQTQENGQINQSQSTNKYFKFEDMLRDSQPHYIMSYFGLSSQEIIGDTQSNEILSNFQINQLIKLLKKLKIFDGIQESQYIALQKDLAQLWSKQKYQQTIKKAQISHLLQTPFMMEIIVQVLPNMITKAFEYTKFNDGFIENFQNNKYDSVRSNLLKNHYQQKIRENENSSLNFNLQKELIKKVVQQSLENVLQNLEAIKFFQNYNISENILKFNQILKFKNQEIYIGEDIDIVIKCFQMTKITAFEFYENFVEFYSESQLQKWRDLGKINNSESYMIDFADYQQSLAIDLTLRQLTQINYTKKGRFQQFFVMKNNQILDQDNWKEKYFANNDDDNYNKILKSCILLTSNGSTYQFTHKSIQEYFVGKYIIDTIIKFQSLNEKKQTQQQWISNEMYNSDSFNISQGQYQGCLKLISDQLEQIKGHETSLLQMVKLSRNSEYIRTASNSIYLLSYLQSYIENYDLSEISITDTMIFGLSLPQCNLSKTQFKNVTIDSCNLNYSNLTDANWQNCIYNETKILTNHKHSVQCITYSKDGKIMISGDSSGKIIIWDTFQTIVLCEYNSNQKDILQLVISNKSNILISVDEENVFIWNIEKPKEPKLIGKINFKFKQIQISPDDQTLIGVYENYYFEWDIDRIIKNFNRPRYLNIKLQNISIILQTLDDNNLFISADTGEILVYEIKHHFKEICQFQAHLKQIEILKISDLKQLLVSASSDLSIKLWNFQNINNIKNVRTIQLTGFNYSNLFFSFNGYDLLGLIGDNFIYDVIDYQYEQQQRKTLNDFPIINNSLLSYKENYILSFEDESILIYDVNNLLQIFRSGKIQYQPQSQPFWFIKTSLLALSFSNRLEIWNFTTQKLYNTIQYKDDSFPKVGSFSNDETQIALLLSNNYLEVYSIKNQNFEIQFEISMELNDNSIYNAYCLEYSQFNNFIALTNQCNLIYVYSTDSFQEQVIQLFDNNLVVQQLLFTSNDNLIIAFKHEITYYHQIKILIFKEKNNIIFKTIYCVTKELFKLFMNYEQNLLIAAFIDDLSTCLIKFNCENLNSLSKQAKFNLIQKLDKSTDIKNLYYIQQQNCIIIENSGTYDQFYLNEDDNKIQVFLNKHEYKVQDLCFSNNRKFLASISDDELFIYNENLEIYKFAQIGGRFISFSKTDSKIFISTLNEILFLDFDQNLTIFYKIEFQQSKEFWHYNGNCYFFFVEQPMFELMYKYILRDKLIESNDNFKNVNYDGNKICIVRQKATDSIQYQMIDFPKKIQSFNQFISQFQYYGEGELILIRNKCQIQFQNQIHNLIFQFDCSAVSFHYIANIKQLIIGTENSIKVYNYRQTSDFNQDTCQSQEYHEFTFERKLTEMCVNEQQQIIISVHENFIQVWNIQDKQQIFSFYAHSKKINSIISSQDGQTFTTGGDDCKVKIWKFQHSQRVMNTFIHLDKVKKIQYSNDSESLLSMSEDQSLIVFDLIKKKAVQKSDIQNEKLLFNSDFIIKSDLENQQFIVYGNQRFFSQQYLELLNCKQETVYFPSFPSFSYDSSNNSFEQEEADQISNNLNDSKISHSDQNQELKIYQQKIFSKDGKFVLYFLDGGIRQRAMDEKDEYSDQFYIFNHFKDLIDDFDRSELKFSNLTFNQTNSSMFIVVTSYKNNQMIQVFKTNEEKVQVLPNDQYKSVKNVILNDDLLLIQENSFELKLFKNKSEFFEIIEIQGQYQHDSDIISVVLNSDFIYFIDIKGILVMLKTNKLEEMKRINLDFTFDEDNAVSTSLLFEQYYAVGLANGILLILNVEQEQKTDQFFCKFQLPKQQPIIQIQFSKNTCVVGCLCDSFIWFINFKSSSIQIFRSRYHFNQNFIFSKNSHFIMHIDSNCYNCVPILSLLYNCINYEYFQEDEEIDFIKFSKDENYLVYDDNAGNLKIYYVKGKCVIKKFKLNNLQVKGAIFSIKNKRLIIFYKKKKQKFIDLLTIQDQQNVFRVQIPADVNKKISAYEISNDEDHLMLATKDSKLYYFSIDNMKNLFTIDDFESFVSSIAFSPNQKEFALGFNDGSILLYNFNYQEFQIEVNQQVQELHYRPICIKIFSRLPQLLSYGCKLNDKTKIENKDGQSLVQILISKQADMIENEE